MVRSKAEFLSISTGENAPSEAARDRELTASYSAKWASRQALDILLGLGAGKWGRAKIGTTSVVGIHHRTKSRKGQRRKGQRQGAKGGVAGRSRGRQGREKGSKPARERAARAGRPEHVCLADWRLGG